MDLDNTLKNMKDLIYPSKNNILKIIEDASVLLFHEPNVLILDGPINIVGDVHGQFFDLLNLFDIGGEIESHNSLKYVFLGDYVDRGYNSLETILYLLLLKIKFPTKIFLLRGNHESLLLTRTYTFKSECESKLDTIIYESICSLFTHMPVAALVHNKIFCVHGGIGPNFRKIVDIDNEWRFTEKSVFDDLFWSDPCDNLGFHKNPRGLGYLFGSDIVDNFCLENDIKFIVRSHQLVMNGYDEKFDGKLFTIWSAPNYCYRSGNMASFMKIDSEGNHEMVIFDECDQQKRNGETGKYFI